MRRVLQAAKSSCVRVVVSVGVLAALCFSVGEGLRLLPLPYPASPASEAAGPSPAASGPGALRQCQFKPGSLGLPPLAQKDLQYKKTHCAPPSGCALPSPPRVRRGRGAQWRMWGDLAAFVPGLAGRAPPHTS